jgi:glycosyltransferase involved in cell wall biosynthesis
MSKEDMPESAYRVVLDAGFLDAEVVVSVVIPCFNQAERIGRTLVGLSESMSSVFELIVIDDASTDGTVHEVLSSLEQLAEINNLGRLRLLRMHRSSFETECDVVGFSVADGDYLLEVQADMEVDDPGFDGRMVRALASFDDLLMVSGRGTELFHPIAESYRRTQGSVVAHTDTLWGYVWSRVRHRAAKPLINWSHRNQPQPFRTIDVPPWEAVAQKIFPDAQRFAETGEAGQLGNLVEVSLPLDHVPTDCVWLGQTVMRGPLMIDRDRLHRVGGLDDSRFFLGFDDHDLVIRAFLDHGLRCGYQPVVFRSPIEAGTTRKRRSLGTEAAILRQLLAIRTSRKSSALFRAACLAPEELPTPELRFLQA